MAFAEGQRGHDLGSDAPHELLRARRGRRRARSSCVFELAPRPEYGLVRPLFRLRGRRRAHVRRPEPGRRRARPCRVDGRRTRRCARAFARRARASGRLRAALGAARGRRRPRRPRRRGRAARIADTVEGWRSWEAEHDIYEGPHRELVRFSARVLKGLTYRPTGAIVAAPTTLAARGRGRRAQLGLPLLLDPRREPHARGALHRRVLGRGRGVRLVHDQRGRRARRRAARCRSCTGSAASTTSPSASCRTCAAGATRARCGSATAPGTRRSSTCTASCSTRSHLYRERLGDLHPGDPGVRRRPRRRRRATAGASRTPACGRCAASRGTTSPRRSCAGWRSTARCKLAPAARRATRKTRRVGRRARPRSATRSSSAAGARSARRYAQSFDSDELDAAALLMPILGFLPATDPRMRSTIEAIAARPHRGRARAALPQRRRAERRRPDAARRARS